VLRRVALLLVVGSGLGLGATALAQDGGSDDPLISMQSGCLTGNRVTVRIVPPAGTILSPVHIRAGDREVVHLTGITSEASVTVRLPGRGTVSVSGETTGGQRFAIDRDYRPCAPEPPRSPTPRPSPPRTVTGGGEG
jgi:hypothetical protein